MEIKRGSYVHSVLNSLFTFVFGSKAKVDKNNKENFERAKDRKKGLTILVHGALANYHRSMYATIRQFAANGIEIISIGHTKNVSIEESAKEIENQIEMILSETKRNKLNLVGICLGGCIARYYAEILGGRKKIDRLVTVFSPVRPIPETDIGFKISKALGNNAGIYNSGISVMKGSFTVENHLSFYGTKDIIINPRYARTDKVKQIALKRGHLFVSYDPTIIEIAARFLKGEPIF